MNSLILADEYIRQENPSAALATLERIEEAAARLSRFPAIGRPGRVPGTRELTIPDTPFLLAYRVKQNAIEILDLLHGARKWPEHF